MVKAEHLLQILACLDIPLGKHLRLRYRLQDAAAGKSPALTAQASPRWSGMPDQSTVWR